MKSGGATSIAGTGRPLAAGAPGASWLARLIVVAAVLVAAATAIYLGMDETFGWDARVNCAAVDAHIAGLDPYVIKNLKDAKYSYPYLPVTLDAFRPLCAGGVLVTHYKAIYLVLAILCALALPGLGKSRRSFRDTALRIIFVLGGFVGLEWILATGNFAILSGLLTSVALALLLRPARCKGQGTKSLPLQFAGAALLGLLTSFKLVYCPILAALYLLPVRRSRKLMLIAVAAGAFALPVLISAVFYANLFPSWLSAISGQIPGQHSPGDDVNPSLLFLALTLADHLGLVGSKLVVVLLYGFAAVALVIAPFVVSVWRMVAARRPADARSALKWFDRWLIEHPVPAMRLVVLAMYALYLCAPRVKEYAFFDVALYAAILVVDLPAIGLAVVLTIAVGLPALASITGYVFIDGFDQLGIALVCFWIMLRAQSQAPGQVVRAAGIEPAQLLRAEGFSTPVGG
ncbi:hypothetical protein [Bradyrhizobium sp. BR 10261]|uniref:hypothetical protein n=1 Tax=Bradyrhizobium sp. BR 10261 TaxID=2749992 RepID=UPI001C647A2C|nr:hypothetical protein [Bradyrhizobium sp. BR 10261]MBW7962983.1 hypothetical protein [Bradyrhizobium sp. BR 10261]